MVFMTRLQFLAIALLVSSFFGIVVALQPGTLQENLLVVALLFVLCTAFNFTITSIQESIKKKNKDSKWLQPVPTTFLVVLINLIVTIWLCVIGLLFFLALATSSDQRIIVGSSILILVGAVLGRYFQKRFVSRTFVPYGASFGVAVIALIVLQRLIA